MRGIQISLFLGVFLALLPVAEARHGNRGAQPAPNPADSVREVDLSKLPPCLDERGNRIDPNNEQVLEWKASTPNQFRSRALIVGTLVGIYDAKKDHLHMDVFVGQKGSTGKENDIEVIYNQEFGRIGSDVAMGANVVACGDYITSNRATGRYPASPLGAILHWVHKAMNGSHPHGFLAIDGKLYGQQDAPPRGPRHGLVGDGFFGYLWANQ